MIKGKVNIEVQHDVADDSHAPLKSSKIFIKNIYKTCK